MENRNKEKIELVKQSFHFKSLKQYKEAIEMLYKGYLINQKPALLNKIEKFLAAYENISLMGHIKLHLVADLC